MKSKVLSQTEIHTIVERMTEPLNKEIEEKTTKTTRYLEAAVEVEAPASVRAMIGEYSQYLRKMGTISAKFGGHWIYPDLSCIYIPDALFNQVKAKIAPVMIERLDEIQKLKTNLKALKNKLTCALESLKTTKRLQNEFPEAFEAYRAYNGIIETKDACTDIETLRAELNSGTASIEEAKTATVEAMKIGVNQFDLRALLQNYGVTTVSKLAAKDVVKYMTDLKTLTLKFK